MGFKESNNFVVLIIRTARPRQWLKNLSLYAAILFGGNFFEGSYFLTVSKAVLIFCGVSSAIYILNDIVDASKDSAHPFKKLRPIAAGKLRKKDAFLVALLLLTALVYLSFKINLYFFSTVIIYSILQISYSLLLRNIIILDALTVAAGFLLRVIAGSVAVLTSISSWLILATIGVSLLLAFGKRRSERTLLESLEHLDPKKVRTRMTLAHYPDALLDSMISMSASFVIITYSLFSFQISPRVAPKFSFYASLIPPTLAQSKWMMLTIPFVIYGVARYLYIIYEKKEGESPERVLLSDVPLLTAVVGWIFLVIAILYGIRGN